MDNNMYNNMENNMNKTQRMHHAYRYNNHKAIQTQTSCPIDPSPKVEINLLFKPVLNQTNQKADEPS